MLSNRVLLCYFSACEHYLLSVSFFLFSLSSFHIYMYNSFCLSSILFFFFHSFLHSSLKFPILKPSPRERVSTHNPQQREQQQPYTLSTSYSPPCLPPHFFSFPFTKSMDFLVGPTFTIDVASSPPPYDADLPGVATAADRPYGLFSGHSSDSESSIGTPDDSDDDENDVVSSKRNQSDEDEDKEEEEEEVHSKLKGLASLDSLEDSLPIKRGLSNHFMGKSKSFTDLSQVNTLNTVKELQKQENPFNKRRRVQIATKLTRKSSFYAWSNPKSMPLLPVHEDEDNYLEEEEKPKKVSPSSSSYSSEENKQDHVLVPKSYVDHMRARFGSFKSRSLSDLKEHDEEQEQEDDDDDA
ncbi:hypothetical protein HKD37_17G048390 [Glycine soja]